MIHNNGIKGILKEYIEKNEVIYQAYGELVEVSNDENNDNRKILLEYLDKASSVEVFEKGASFIHDPFEDLDKWSTSDDILFLLETIGVLICIPRKVAIEREMIET